MSISKIISFMAKLTKMRAKVFWLLRITADILNDRRPAFHTTSNVMTAGLIDFNGNGTHSWKKMIKETKRLPHALMISILTYEYLLSAGDQSASLFTR